MPNSKKSAKSKGVILFAFNTNVDYVLIADKTSRLIAHNLKLPVTLVTDNSAEPKFEYDNIIRVEPESGNYRTDLNNQTVSWNNFGRYLAYELSPYESTVLMDVDYLVLDNNLLKVLNTTQDYRLMHHNYTDAGPSYEQMGETSLPFVWATVLTFNKTERSRLFFNLVGRIQRNYQYYRALYNIREGNYRNDYAFAIANIIISGYDTNESQGIPWPMYTVDQSIEKIISDKTFLRICFKDKATVVPYQNIHVMDKDYLLSENFNQLVEAVCESA